MPAEKVTQKLEFYKGAAMKNPYSYGQILAVLGESTSIERASRILHAYGVRHEIGIQPELWVPSIYFPDDNLAAMGLAALTMEGLEIGLSNYASSRRRFRRVRNFVKNVDPSVVKKVAQKFQLYLGANAVI